MYIEKQESEVNGENIESFERKKSSKLSQTLQVRVLTFIIMLDK